MRVYLSGPISNGFFSEDSDWRVRLKERLEPLGIECRWALRNRDYDSFRCSLADQYDERKYEISQQILAKDFNSLATSDVLFANFIESPHQPSLGTCVEIGRAEILSIPIVTAVTPESVHDHISILEASNYIFTEFEQSVEHLIKMKERLND